MSRNTNRQKGADYLRGLTVPFAYYEEQGKIIERAHKVENNHLARVRRRRGIITKTTKC